jgi:hypothetical protein
MTNTRYEEEKEGKEKRKEKQFRVKTMPNHHTRATQKKKILRRIK